MTTHESRRKFIAVTGTVALTALAGCADGDDESRDTIEDIPTAIDEYLEDAPNYEGTMVDATGEDRVSVSLTLNNVFEPAAIRIDAGTTVEWVWEGGGHNVVSDEDSATEFDSGEVVAEEGTTFEQTFDDAGIQLYYCEPHTTQGMYGGIEVVD